MSRSNKKNRPWLTNPEYLRHRREAGRIYRNMRYATDPKWRAKEKARATRARRKAVLQERYGISIKEYEAVLAAQGGACAVCKTTSRRLLIDQSPETGVLLGLLCRECKGLVNRLRWRQAVPKEHCVQCTASAAPDHHGPAND
jgi:hypothetical protein